MLKKIICAVIMPKSKAPKQGFYAVHVGKTKGIYYTWPDCEKQVSGVVGAKFKKFDTQKEAEEFVRNGPRLNYTKPSHNGSTAASGKPYAATAAGRSHHTSSVSPGTTSKAGSAVNTKATKDNIRISNGVRMTSSDTLVVYTDGSALGNGKAKSQAGVGVFLESTIPGILAKDWTLTLRRIKELNSRLTGWLFLSHLQLEKAAYRALEACGSDTKPIEIRTDSMYTVNIVTKWAEGWAKNNWRRSDGDPVMNRDIIEPLMEKIKKRPGPINWVHVRAHVGEFGNEMADRLANAGAVMPRPTRS